MHIAFVFVLQCVTCVLSHDSCPAACRCSYTSTAQLAVFCKGDSLSHVTSQLPADTVIYHYEAHERVVKLGSTNFSHLTSLESLQLASPYDHLVLDRIIREIPLSQQEVFWPLVKLKELKININWELQTALPELLSPLSQLEVLDLSNTRLLQYMNLKNTLYGLKNSTTFKTLNLRNTQTMEILQNGFILNLTDLLDPLKDCPLEELDISYNALRTVIPGLISKAPRLTKLDASNNFIIPLLSAPFFIEVVVHPAIVEADFSEQGLGEPQRTTTNDNATLSEVIYYAWGGMEQKLIKRRMNHHNNSLYQESKNCINEVLDDLCNVFKPECAEILHECAKNPQLLCDIFAIISPYTAAIPCEYFPPVYSLLDKNCGGCFVFPLIGNVRKLYLQMINNYDEVLAFPVFKNKTCFSRNNSLEVMDFSRNGEHGYAEIDLSFSTTVQGFDSMNVFNLSHNKMRHPASNLGHNLPQIEVFDLSYNLLDLQGKDGDFLVGATSVQELNLAGNIIQEIPYNRFTTLTRLQTLNLSSNSLQTLSIDIHNLSVLSYIDLSGNKISSFSQDMTTQLSAQAAKLHNISLKIDLSQNSLLCTCSVRHFINWVLSQPHNVEFVNFHDYMCLNEASYQVPFHKLNNLDIFDCLSRDVYIGVGVGSGILLSVCITLIIIAIYRKRWWMRYHYFIARKMWTHSRRKEEESHEFHYDVFVSYNRHDKDWVDEILQPKLEDENGIRLCLHERDFELGGQISEQIIDSIEKSRKVLLILSPHFIRSNWCKFEMTMALQKLVTKGHDVLLLAILKPLNGVEITKTLKALLEQKTYVEWSEDQYGQKLFWAKLITALNIPKRSASTVVEEDDTGTGGRITDDVEAPLIHDINQPSTSSA